jgi:hypothetical protein
MTGETLTRGLRARGRRRRGRHEHPADGEHRSGHGSSVEQAPDTLPPQQPTEPQPVSEPTPETEWSAHRMASVLCMLAAFASEEPVHSLDQGQAWQDMSAARLLHRPPDGSWTPNAAGRKLLAAYGLDQPIPVEVRKLTDAEREDGERGDGEREDLGHEATEPAAVAA